MVVAALEARDPMIVVATTLTTFALDDPETWGSWLLHAEEVIESHPEGVRYFVAIETDARGVEPFYPLIEAVTALGGDYWTFQLDDGRTEVTTANRLRHITMGQNLCVDYALSQPDCTHLLFLAADQEIPADTLPKLLALGHPLVGGHVPTYCLDGPTTTIGDRKIMPRHRVGESSTPGFPADWDVRTHMGTAAFVLIRRDLLRFVRWRWDLDAGMSDDPCLHHDARRFHGVEWLVRHDCVGVHHPESIGPVEGRGHDMAVHRAAVGGVADPPWVDLHAEGRAS